MAKGKLNYIEVRDIAKRMAESFKYYQGDIWLMTTDKGWENRTNGDGKDVWAIRSNVKLYFEGKYVDGEYNEVDIDAVTKELRTDLKNPDKTFDPKDLDNRSMYFINGKLSFKENGDLIWKEGDMSFSPLTIQLKFDINRFKDETIYPKTCLKRMIDNMTPNKQALIYEHMAYHLMGQHSGVALSLVGRGSIGKTTLSELLGYAMTKSRQNKTTHLINAKDIMETGGDQFAFYMGVNKPTWIVPEGSSTLARDKTNLWKEWLDETSKVMSIRAMNKGTQVVYKIFNLIVCSNDPFEIYSDTADTQNAIKERISVIIARATKGVLSMEEYQSLFTDFESEQFVFESIRAYQNLLSRGKKRRIYKFTPGDEQEFWLKTEDENKAESIIKAGSDINKFGKIDELTTALAQTWNVQTMDFLSNKEIMFLIQHYRNCQYELTNSYTSSTFKRDLQKIAGREHAPVEIRPHEKRIGKEKQYGLKIKWKVE